MLLSDLHMQQLCFILHRKGIKTEGWSWEKVFCLYMCNNVLFSPTNYAVMRVEK